MFDLFNNVVYSLICFYFKILFIVNAVFVYLLFVFSYDWLVVCLFGLIVWFAKLVGGFGYFVFGVLCRLFFVCFCLKLLDLGCLYGSSGLLLRLL